MFCMFCMAGSARRGRGSVPLFPPFSAFARAGDDHRRFAASARFSDRSPAEESVASTFGCSMRKAKKAAGCVLSSSCGTSPVLAYRTSARTARAKEASSPPRAFSSMSKQS